MALQISCLLILTGLTGIFSISIVKRVTVKAGDSVSIPCLYEAKYKNHVKYLCKGWYHCSSIVKTSQQNSQRFSISDEKEQRVFTVTINNLTNEDMDDYWCAVEINGQVDDKAHFHLSASGNPYLYVDDQWITAYEGDNITIKCFNHYGGVNQWCRLGGTCVKSSSGWINGTRVSITESSNEFFTVNMYSLSMENSGWYMCYKGNYQMPVHINITTVTTQNGQHSALKMFLIPLSLLIFLVMATVVTWFFFKRQKQAKVESSATTTEEKIKYSAVSARSETTRQNKSDPESDVIYTTVVTKQKQRMK